MAGRGNLGQIKLASLNNECYIRIKNAILSGDFAWGDRLDVGQLAAEFGISKFPVIKALDRLAIEHLVIILPNKGTFVANPDVSDIEEITEIRRMIENAALRLGAQKDLQALISLLEAVEKKAAAHLKHFCEGQEFIEFLNYDREYHECFLVASKNKRLMGYYKVIRSQVELFRTKTFYSNNISKTLNAHHLVLELLKKGNIEKAAEALKSHIEQVHTETLDSIFR
jgi:DNA-binding GntR family transcriptional regulator